MKTIENKKIGILINEPLAISLILSFNSRETNDLGNSISSFTEMTLNSKENVKKFFLLYLIF